MQHKSIIEAEVRGLKQLSEVGVITPKVIGSGSERVFSFILMEYIAESDSGNTSNVSIAKQLSHLHKVSSSHYGAVDDNYIGILPQSNISKDNFIDFYIDCRIHPQFLLATDSAYLQDLAIDKFYKQLDKCFVIEDPTLVHGDLWSGNLLVRDGQAVFIDPSVAFSHREFDLAMMQLFGGFDEEVFEIYNELFPIEKGWLERRPLFELYYLLVHLNMFGKSYEGSVRSIIERYL